MGAIVRAAAIIRRASIAIVAGGAACVIVIGTAYVVAQDSRGELGPPPAAHVAPRPSPAP